MDSEMDAPPSPSCALAASHEARLIAAAQAGDHAAFAALHASYRAAVVTRLSYLRGPGGSVEDLVQETFLRAYKSLPRFRGGCPFRYWLLRIATHVARSEHRSLRRSLWRLFAGDEEEHALHPSAPAQPELYPELHALYAALRRLSPRLREAVVLFDLEGRTLAEIAIELDSPIHTIAARVRRGRATLRKTLEGTGASTARTLLPCHGDAP
jgi:RNA polymerase sigma-70 factor (ECF subfamily)